MRFISVWSWVQSPLGACFCHQPVPAWQTLPESTNTCRRWFHALSRSSSSSFSYRFPDKQKLADLLAPAKQARFSPHSRLQVRLLLCTSRFRAALEGCHVLKSACVACRGKPLFLKQQCFAAQVSTPGQDRTGDLQRARLTS